VGILDGMRGNASKVDASKAQEDYEQLLGDGQSMEHAYKLVRGLFLFTNRCLVLVEKL
jgi:hypothetical protein